jgi:hypothetical protein
MKKMFYFALFFGVATFALIIIASCAKQPGPIGGQRDEHGCLGPAGYSWDADIGACTRSWEIKGDLAQAAKIAVASLSAQPITVVEVTPLNCTACYAVKLQIGENQVLQTVIINNGNICGDCPLLSQPSPGWCSDGTIVAGEKNICGCQGPPKCIKACTQEAKICPDGTAVGRDGENNCEFTPCPQTNTSEENLTYMKLQPCVINFVCIRGTRAFSDEKGCGCKPETLSTTCTEEQKQAEACTMQYDPVCGDDGVTYGNACGACASKKINSWTKGECPAITYVSRDLERCKVIRYACIQGKEPFSDAIGCGCRPVTGKLKATDCLPNQRNQPCTKEYLPVCGWNDPEKIQCFAYPCASTYGNKCEACANENVISWTEGICPPVGG